MPIFSQSLMQDINENTTPDDRIVSELRIVSFKFRYRLLLRRNRYMIEDAGKEEK